MAAILIVLAVLSLAAGITIHYRGKKSLKKGDEIQEIIKERKAGPAASETVNNCGPAEASELEYALLFSHRDPLEIYMDADASKEDRKVAEKFLRENEYLKDKPEDSAKEGQKEEGLNYAQNVDSSSTEDTEPDMADLPPSFEEDVVDVAISDEFASDEGLEAPDDLGED